MECIQEPQRFADAMNFFRSELIFYRSFTPLIIYLHSFAILHLILRSRACQNLSRFGRYRANALRKEFTQQFFDVPIQGNAKIDEDEDL